MFEQIKAVLSDDMVFYGLLVVLVGVSGFGLGRWSVEADVAAHQSAGIVLSKHATESVASSSQSDLEPTVPIAEAAGQFVGSRNSDKYHLPWCPGAQRIKEENKVWFESKAAAEAQGYAPAANCPGL